MNRRPLALFAAYPFLLLILTFWPIDGFSGTTPVDLRLQAFRTINFALRKGVESHQFLILIGNVVAFMPLGMLVPLIVRRNSLATVFLVAFVTSLAIEMGQLAVSISLGFAYRSADIDDVIVNVFGALLGYAVFVAAGLATRGEAAGDGNSP